jgi:hypothetical protein
MLFRLSEPFGIPIIVSIIFLLLSIYPVLPMIGLYLNGGLFGVFEDIFFEESDNRDSNLMILNWAINFGLSVYFFILFIAVKKTWAKIIFTVLSILFLFYFLVFTFMTQYEDALSNYIFFIVLSLLSCIGFNIAVTIRHVVSSR